MNKVIDWENPFKSSDFQLAKIVPDNEADLWKAKLGEILFGQHLADMANARFRELLKDAPEVHGIQQMGEYWDFHECKMDYMCKSRTHSARLICIEEIKK